MKRVLIVLKFRDVPLSTSTNDHPTMSTGLYNSASFIQQALSSHGIESKLVVVADANSIDREVTLYRPTDVILEALWVPPTKFKELVPLHKKVRWIIRLHSEIPFIAGEGMAMDWIGDYLTYPTVCIAPNSPRMLEEMLLYARVKGLSEEEAQSRVFYLPNSYPKDFKRKTFRDSEEIHIGCFGAVRPLKNHLNQALAAMRFADDMGKKLRFHVNGSRIEGKGEPVMRNLTSLFLQTIDSGHRLVNHDWSPREEFLEICSQMDIGMQVSFSETFNIVAADFVSQGVPIVTSEELPWVDYFYSARPTRTLDMVLALKRTYESPSENVSSHQNLLLDYVENSERIWINTFKFR